MMASWWPWLGLGGVLCVSVAIDLGVHRGKGEDGFAASLGWAGAWIALALGFGAVIRVLYGGDAATEYFGAWALEKILSFDNLLVFAVIFEHLAIPREQQRRVLTWGIFGALAARAVFVGVGVAALGRWQWLVVPLGFGLVALAAMSVRTPKEGEVPFAVRLLGRGGAAPSSKKGALWTRARGARLGVRLTTLGMALVAIELSDVFFAVDSIPAAFAVTQRPFILYAANAMALLGLRSLYQVIAVGMRRLPSLRFGLALLLALAGVKLVVAHWVDVPEWSTLAVLPFALGLSMVPDLASRQRAFWTRPRMRWAVALAAVLAVGGVTWAVTAPRPPEADAVTELE